MSELVKHYQKTQVQDRSSKIQKQTTKSGNSGSVKVGTQLYSVSFDTFTLNALEFIGIFSCTCTVCIAECDKVHKDQALVQDVASWENLGSWLLK